MNCVYKYDIELDYKLIGNKFSEIWRVHVRRLLASLLSRVRTLGYDGNFNISSVLYQHTRLGNCSVFIGNQGDNYIRINCACAKVNFLPEIDRGVVYFMLTFQKANL